MASPSEAVAPTTPPDFISPADPYFDQPEPPKPPAHKTCGQYARVRKQCPGCGKTVKASLMRCHDTYLCNNCMRGRILAYAWLKRRDPHTLGHMAHTRGEFTLRTDPSLSQRDRETIILAAFKRLTARLGCDWVRMPMLDTLNPSLTRIRVSFAASLKYYDLSSRWREIVGRDGWVEHVERMGSDSITDWLGWVFSGQEPLWKLTDDARLDVQRHMYNSSRIVCNQDGVYSSLPAERIHELREAQKTSTCTCGHCGAMMEDVDGPPMLIEELQKAYPTTAIDWSEDYNPFEIRRTRDIANARSNISGLTNLGSVSFPASPPN